MNIGTLIFLTTANSDFDAAVEASGGISNAATHVGIYGGKNKVIDAHPNTGVAIRSFNEFAKDSTRIITCEIANQEILPAAITRALKLIDRPYNYTFCPSAYGIYCSQLITETFLYPNGKRYFNLYKMRFDDIAYWKKYYAEFGLNVPHGTMGSHPQQILEQADKFINKEIHEKRYTTQNFRKSLIKLENLRV